MLMTDSRNGDFFNQEQYPTHTIARSNSAKYDSEKTNTRLKLDEQAV